MSDLNSLKTKLQSDPAASRKFHTDFINLLKANGVNTDDPTVQQKLGLDKLNPAKMNVGAAQSTVVVTIVM